MVAVAIALAGCAQDGTPISTGDSGSIDSFVRNLFGSKNEDQTPVADNEAPGEPSVNKTKPADSTPKHPVVAAARARPAKHQAEPANKKPAVALAAKPPPKRQASAEPQRRPESKTPHLLSGAAPTAPVESFDNSFSSPRQP
jgi:hypothetical protein